MTFARPFFLAAIAASCLTSVACSSGGADDLGNDLVHASDSLDAIDATTTDNLDGEEIRLDAVDESIGDEGSEVPFWPDTLVMDDVIRLNQIQIKGTHNSYHIESPDTAPEWKYTMDPLDVQLDRQSVRQVELDIHLSIDNDIEVYHVPFLDPLTTCLKFKDCLGIIRKWSDENPSHLPIFILIEPKDELDPEELQLLGKMGMVEDEILEIFPIERIITPDEVRAGHSSLREALEQDGWPTLSSCRGRVIFLMLDNVQHLDSYLQLHPNLEGALIFGRNGRDEPWSSMLELMNPENESRFAEIQQAVLENYIVRTNADDSDTPKAEATTRAARAIESGGHLINTDHPTDRNVTTDDPYSFDLPGGVAAVCNQANAPDGCTPEVLEKLK